MGQECIQFQSGACVHAKFGWDTWHADVGVFAERARFEREALRHASA
jgi:hypothetical protein